MNLRHSTLLAPTLCLLMSACGFITYSINGVVPAKFFAVDSTNNRVLIWNSFPTSIQQPADLVLGQPNLSSTSINAGLGVGSATAQTLYTPIGVSSDGTRLMIADELNNRVLIWNSIPSVSQQPADIVLGQSNMSSNSINSGLGAGSASSQSLYDPFFVYSDGTRLLVSDLENNRILIWNSFPTSNQQATNLVLGQPSMSVNSINAGGGAANPTSQTLYRPGTFCIVGNRLIVADYYNSRVLIWNTFPTINQQPADIVLGQPGMTTSVTNNTPGNPGTRSAQSFFRPGAVTSDGVRLFVADTFNHRVLIWNSIPTTHQAPANIVLGQPDMSTGAANYGGTPSAQTMNAPQSVFIDSTRFYVTEYSNHRILIWNSIPSVNQQAADLVLGQATMSAISANGGGAASSQTLNNPTTIFSNLIFSGVWRPGGY